MPRIAILLIFLLSTVATAEDWPSWRGKDRNGRSESKNLKTNWETKSPKLRWIAEGFGSGYSSVAISNGMIYTTGNIQADRKSGQAIIAAKADDGEIAWRTVITKGPPNHGYKGARSTPTINDGHIYAVASDGQIVCLKASDGTVVWSKSFQKEWKGRMMSGWGFSESPLIDGDTVLCTPGGKQAAVVALNKKTGEEIWRCAAPTTIGDGKNDAGAKLKYGAGYSSIIATTINEKKQYIQFLGQGIIGIDADNGKVLWSDESAGNAIANITTPITTGDYVFLHERIQHRFNAFANSGRW